MAILALVVILMTLLIVLIGAGFSKNEADEKLKKEKGKRKSYYREKTKEKSLRKGYFDDFNIETEISHIKRENKEWSKDFAYSNELFEIGNREETLGNLEEAVKAYNGMIDFCINSRHLGYNNYARSINRLIVIYRKQKKYRSEIEIIKLALRNDMNEKSKKKYTERLKKAELLLTKTT